MESVVDASATRTAGARSQAASSAAAISSSARENVIRIEENHVILSEAKDPHFRPIEKLSTVKVKILRLTAQDDTLVNSARRSSTPATTSCRQAAQHRRTP